MIKGVIGMMLIGTGLAFVVSDPAGIGQTLGNVAFLLGLITLGDARWGNK